MEKELFPDQVLRIAAAFGVEDVKDIQNVKGLGTWVDGEKRYSFPADDKSITVYIPNTKRDDSDYSGFRVQTVASPLFSGIAAYDLNYYLHLAEVEGILEIAVGWLWCLGMCHSEILATGILSAHERLELVLEHRARWDRLRAQQGINEP